MTPEAQNAAIARAVGGWPLDYLNSLDAMHEAEEALSAEQAREYHRQLQLHPEPCGWMWHIGAKRKAEAFLKATGLWV